MAALDPAAKEGLHEVGTPVLLASQISFTITSAIVEDKLTTGTSGQPLQDQMLAQILFKNSSDLDARGPDLSIICAGVVGHRIAFGSGNSYDPTKLLHPGQRFEGYSVVSYPRYCDDGVLAGIFPDGTQITWVLPPGTDKR